MFRFYRTMPPRTSERVRRGKGRPLLEEEDEVRLKKAPLEMRDRIRIGTLVTWIIGQYPCEGRPSN